jgi:DNA-binding LacI/PurR family transcriptional regulator
MTDVENAELPGAHRSAPLRRAVSMTDVAAAAGVSKQTVSRVLNGHPYVNTHTREIVESTMRDLGYRPSNAARALATGQSRTVTVLSTNTTLYGYASTLQGIEEAARRRGIALVISVIESAEADVIQSAVAAVSDPRSGSVIVIAYDRIGLRILQSIPAGIPHAAAIGRSFSAASNQKPDPRWVWLADYEAAYNTTNYLLSLGHETVHHVPIPSWTKDQREGGWRAALVDAGARVPELPKAGWDARGGYQAGKLLVQDPTVTAILAGNDDLALGVFRALGEAGVRIPDDISVVGFDDAPHSEFLTPSLSTVRLDFVGLGRACFDVLYDQISGQPGSRLHPLAVPQLVVRESISKLGPRQVRDRPGQTGSP